jgi:8-oxo-dGTP pyrophosphatase MutT (NUDIX family)
MAARSEAVDGRSSGGPGGRAGRPAPDEMFHPCPAGRHWGPRGAAGILPWTVTPDGRAWVLLSHRSPNVQAGGSWSTFGGAIDDGETPWHAAVRETSEEIEGIDVRMGTVAAKIEVPCEHGWQEDGTLSVRYWSEAAKERRDPAGIFYFWTGERPRHPDAPQLEGTGEIKVETTDRATGYWTTRSDRDPGLNARTSGVYRRADPSDLQVLDGGSEEERAQLIAQRLREWKSAANAF